MADQNRPIFTGVAVALATLFTDELEVDYEATARHARSLVSAGVRAVVVCGTTGEPEALSDEERLELLDAVLDAVGGQVPVIMGAGLPSARQAATFAARVRTRAIAAILARSPRGVPDPVPFYQAVATSVGDTPLLAYHFPATAPPGIPLDALSRAPIAGVKDSSADPARLLATLDAYDGCVYLGSAVLLLMGSQLGCAGAILQLANSHPELCAEAFAGQPKAQREVYSLHARSRNFPHGIKELMAARFGTSLAARLG
ncbi:MAG: dihydrodipicolinate synthase family protein [Micromonosporaceae bacterium]|nr:dihydrodipicolinate synthase family protein [Micromonosporaceae bacterium]